MSTSSCIRKSGSQLRGSKWSRRTSVYSATVNGINQATVITEKIDLGLPSTDVNVQPWDGWGPTCRKVCRSMAVFYGWEKGISADRSATRSSEVECDLPEGAFVRLYCFLCHGWSFIWACCRSLQLQQKVCCNHWHFAKGLLCRCVQFFYDVTRSMGSNRTLVRLLLRWRRRSTGG